MPKKKKKVPEQDKKNTSLRLDRKTLKALKQRALEADTSVQQILERLILDFLGKH